VGVDFAQKHPSCGILTCCYKTQGLECCGECPKYPCDKIKPWGSGDSFISHKMCLGNLDQIKSTGIKPFIQNQAKRIEILQLLLNQFDDGKSKMLYCLTATLLPLEKLLDLIQKAIVSSSEKKIQILNLKEFIKELAQAENISLKLRK